MLRFGVEALVGGDSWHGGETLLLGVVLWRILYGNS